MTYHQMGDLGQTAGLGAKLHDVGYIYNSCTRKWMPVTPGRSPYAPPCPPLWTQFEAYGAQHCQPSAQACYKLFSNCPTDRDNCVRGYSAAATRPRQPAKPGTTQRALFGLGDVTQGQSPETPQPIGGGAPPSEYDCMYAYYQAQGGQDPKYAGMSQEQRDEVGYADYLACREAAFTFQPPNIATGQRVPFGTPTRPYREGSIGPYGPSTREYGTLTRPYHDGILGGRVGLGADYPGVAFEGTPLPGGLSYTVGGTTLDLMDPAVLREVKSILRSTNAGAANYSGDDFDVAWWTDATQAAFNDFAFALEKSRPGMAAWIGAPAMDSKGVPHIVPTAVGIQMLKDVAQMDYGKDAAITLSWFAGSFPNVQAWLDANGGMDANMTGLVNPPAFSEAELPKKAKKMSMLYVGLGVGVVALGVWWLARKAA